MKRHENALEMQEATNLCAIARSLAAATEEAVSDGVGAERDAAVRLMTYRLAQMCRVDDISYGYDSSTLADTFRTLMDECKLRAQESEQAQEQRLLEGTRGRQPRLLQEPDCRGRR